ncbi:hypothetical protein D3C85_1610680 [compost metagenome]
MMRCSLFKAAVIPVPVVTRQSEGPALTCFLIRSLAYRYAKVEALPVSLEKECVLAIIGPTLFRMISSIGP